MEITAIILGLAGSLHCMLMCSPLAMAVTSGGSNAFQKKLIYNLGRILTYGFIGALIALFGSAMNLSGFHLVFTIAVSATLIIMGLAGLTSLKIPFVTPALAKLTSVIKYLFGAFLQRKTLLSIFILGMLNGLLPCGMTYLALTYCLTLAGPLDGFTFMFLFGAGTLPAMLGLTTGLTFLLKNINFQAYKATRIGFVFLGLLVLARLFVFHHQDVMHAMNTGNILYCQ